MSNVLPVIEMPAKEPEPEPVKENILPETGDGNMDIINEIQEKKVEFDDDIIIVKSHNLDIDWFVRHWSIFYDIYFVCSERKEKKLFIDDKYKGSENVICFDYSELNETNKNSLEKIVETIKNKLKDKFPNHELNTKTSLLRLMGMNEEYEQIKEKPFSYVDEFYHIHGSHRNRTDD